MHTPTKSQWQVVIDNFRKVLPIAKRDNQLNMREGSVNYKHTCGTVHCVGGWYAIACDLHLTRDVSFIHGAVAMAEHLGFEDDIELEGWADENIDLWGNLYGRYIFSCSSAYDNARNLADVVTFLEGVRDRSPE